MDEISKLSEATAVEWAAILAESEAEAGLFISGNDIMRELRESIARMNGGAVADHVGSAPGTPLRR